MSSTDFSIDLKAHTESVTIGCHSSFIDETGGDVDPEHLWPDPLGSLRVTLRGRLVRRHAGDRVLSAEIAACVARTPELAAVVATRIEGLSSRLARIIGSACNLLEPAALHRARAVLLIMHGAMTSPPIPGWESEQVTNDVLSVLDRVIQGSGDAT